MDQDGILTVYAFRYEMGVSPIAPAVANAVFAATGKRIRHVPIKPDDLKE